MAEPLTEFQAFALERIKEEQGNNWFDAYDLPAVIRRPNHTCRVLADKGYLEMRHTQNYFWPTFRVRPGATDTEGK